ncbi:MAG: DUF5069 domain-containing protein [Opitutales bacterium]
MTATASLPNAKDLSKDVPSSPHAQVGGYVLAGRILDKCRATLAGTNGEYHFACPLDQQFFGFTGIDADAFKDFVATGADDAAVGKWIIEHSARSEPEAKLWNLQMKDTRITDMPIHLQLFLHDYVAEFIPANRRVYTWFDVYDLEEGHI